MVKGELSLWAFWALCALWALVGVVSACRVDEAADGASGPWVQGAAAAGNRADGADAASEDSGESAGATPEGLKREQHCGAPAWAPSQWRAWAAADSSSATPPVEGVVTGLLPRARPKTFFLQDRRAAATGPRGLLVDASAWPGELPAVGQWVRLEGDRVERGGGGALRATDVLRCGAWPLPHPFELRLPVDLVALGRNHDAERVAVAGDAVIDDLSAWGTLGQLGLGKERWFVGDRAANDGRNWLWLDDGDAGEMPEPLPFFDARGLRLGDVVTDTIGILDGSSGQPRVLPTGDLRVKRENPRPLAPETCAPDRLRIAAFNVENYFSSLSGRGARNSAEQFAQQSKLKAAILALDADVLGLLELENDGGTTQAALRDALRIPERPDLDYAVAPEPSDVGDDRIRSALLYRPGRVGLVENGTFSDGSAVYERPPRAQGFSFAGRGLAVVLVHEKSKSCAGASAVQADLGEGCFNSCRTDQARELITFTRRVTDALGPRVVVMGDFNSYSKEQPLLLLEAAGFGDVLERLPASERYSFVFSGRAGLLDHLYASPELAADVTGQGIWHIDADEAPRLGYHGLGGEGFSLDPFRASDHDPIWLCTR